MELAQMIRQMRESTEMNRREFSEYTSIPLRTIEDWEAGKRTPPSYIPRLLRYQLLYDQKLNERGSANE
ncbi:MAG: transcriptional regulator [Lachnospiraceae bacterium]|nr:transcriptional regulator [Lachnospiraceae bacterium]